MLKPHRIARTPLLLLLLLLVACGPGTREKTLSTTLLSVNAARDGFLAWEHDYVTGMARAAGTKEAANAAIDKYVVESDPVDKSFTLAYQLIATALLHKDTPLPTVIAQAESLYEAIKAFKASHQETP